MQTPPLRKILSLVCPVLSSLCLVLGYQHINLVLAAGLGLGNLFIWLAARQWPSRWAISLALAVSTAAAVYSLVMGGLSILMIISAALNLANWDILLFDFTLMDNPPSLSSNRLEKIHFQYLGLALGAGLFIALLGRLIHFQIPFIFMLALVVLAYLCMDRMLRYLLH